MLYGLDGQPLRTGKVTRTLTADFLTGALPSWLVASVGTITFDPVASTQGRVVCTPTGANLAAGIKTSFTLSAAQWTEIAWTVEGLRFSEDGGFNCAIAVVSSNGGVVFRHNSGETRARLDVRNSAGTYTAPLDWYDGYRVHGQGNGPQSRNLTLAWQVARKRVVMLADDQVIGESDVSDGTKLALGTGIAPEFYFTRVGGNATAVMRAAQVKLSLSHD